MIDDTLLIQEFKKHNGIMRTSELNDLRYDSRYILRLLNEEKIVKLKKGVYQLSEDIDTQEEVIISKLFPSAVIYLNSALFHYRYTDRIPSSWHIAVDKNIAKSQFKIAYPIITPFYLKNKFMDIGVSEYYVDNFKVKIFNKERTICDVLRYENKMDKEVFNKAIQSYIKDKEKNINRLMEYAKILRVVKKIKIYIGVWL
jgi:predicted transcriptional regulator of viral defense system